MSVKQTLVRPLEMLAGCDYPDAEAIRTEATEGQASMEEVNMLVSWRRHEFAESLMVLRGLRSIISGRRS